MSTKININVRRITVTLMGIVLLFALVSFVTNYIEVQLGPNINYWQTSLIRLVNTNREANIPTWYASALLLACAFILAIIALAKFVGRESYRWHWAGLAAIFVFLSIDEAAAMHEILSPRLQAALGSKGYLYFAWVPVAVAFAMVIGVMYLGFLLHLPVRTRLFFVISAGIYVGAAAGIEAFTGNIWYVEGGRTLYYSTIATLEESLEAAGIILFIHTLLHYMGGHVGRLEFEVAPAQDIHR